MNTNHRHSNADEFDEARLTAYALGQLDEEERAAVEAYLAGLDAEDADKLRRMIEETRALAGHVSQAAHQEPYPDSSPALRAAVERQLVGMEDSPMASTQDARSARDPRRNRRLWLMLAVTASMVIAAVPVYLFVTAKVGRETADQVAMTAARQETQWHKDELGSQGLVLDGDRVLPESTAETSSQPEAVTVVEVEGTDVQVLRGSDSGVSPVREQALLDDMYAVGQATEGGTVGGGTAPRGMPGMPGLAAPSPQPTAPAMMPGAGPGAGVGSGAGMGTGGYGGMGGGYPGAPQAGYAGAGMYAPAMPGGSPMYGGGYEDMYGAGYEEGQMGAYAGGPRGGSTASGSGRTGGQAHVGDDRRYVRVSPSPWYREGEEGGLSYPGGQPARQGQALSEGKRHEAAGSVTFSPDGRHLASGSADRTVPRLAGKPYGRYYYEEYDVGDSWRRVPSTRPAPAPGTEQYDAIVENEFLPVGARPLSTFSIDVDTASYANVRRFLTDGRLPPPDAVRIEEMVNYFRYDYPTPEDEVPFSVNMEVTQCPWQGRHRLLRIGLKGREVEREQRGPSNLVFLLDVSGSMRDENKLPLVKQAMRLLVDQLTEDDRVAIVTYASSAAHRLESTGGHDKQRILDAIDALSAGGSTHGSAGIQLAYQQAEQHFVEEGTNRVILATDGDLNVGITDDDELVKLIRRKAKSGVFLTVLGFGTGNLKDSKMEKLADHGNGIYAYVDNLREARKVLMEQVTGSLVTIAKDVKIQIEFNPAEVEAYRLIGYENRMLAARDFDNDKKDAGEIGAGHTVTALYELVPAGAEPAMGEGGPMLKYQRVPQPPAGELTEEAQSGELLTLRLRYKEPDGNKSKLLEYVAKDPGKRFGQATPDFQFAAAVAAFGMVLRGSRYAGDLTLDAVEEFAVSGMGNDPGGYRAEFVDLIRRARGLRGH